MSKTLSDWIRVGLREAKIDSWNDVYVLGVKMLVLTAVMGEETMQESVDQYRELVRRRPELDRLLRLNYSMLRGTTITEISHWLKRLSMTYSNRDALTLSALLTCAAIVGAAEDAGGKATVDDFYSLVGSAGMKEYVRQTWGELREINRGDLQ